MALLLPVLVRNINNLSDARYCAGMGADGLIFTLDPTLGNALPLDTVRELAGWVAGVDLIGEFTPSGVSYAAIKEIVDYCQLTKVLLHYSEKTDADFFAPADLHVQVIVAVSPYYVFDQYEADCLTESLTEHFPAGFALLSDVSHFLDNPSGRKRVVEMSRQHTFWLGGQFRPEMIQQALALAPQGFILEGGHEIKPGLRDFDQLEAVFEALAEE